MITIGIICEYNPFHNGHAAQFHRIRAQFGADSRIVCLMSGSYVQRGAPAVFDKLERAKAAVACGADVVLELPIPYALSSAEGFAAGGVRILTALQVDYLCFGSESGDGNIFMSTARLLLDVAMNEKIRSALKSGISYAAAREQAVAAISTEYAEVLKRPNDILAVEYCKAILQQNSPMKIFPILRSGDYHAQLPDRANPSATALRALLSEHKDISPFIPAQAAKIFDTAEVHSAKAGERAMLARLKGMTEEDFSKLPYGSEGLWRRFMHACQADTDIESIITDTKSKRYARARIQRMLLCAVLGLTEQDLTLVPDFVRILAFSEQGRQVLRQMNGCALPLAAATETVRHSAYAALEERCERMYFLFAKEKKK